MRVMPGKPRVSPARADAFLCSWLSHQDVELTLMAFLRSNPLEKQLFWWLSVPAVTMACLGEQPALMPIIPLALFLTESDHSSINLKIATIFVVDIINLLCVYVPSLFQALMLHHSPADPLLLWHKKTLSKTWLFHKKSTNYRLCVLCSVSSLPGWFSSHRFLAHVVCWVWSIFSIWFGVGGCGRGMFTSCQDRGWHWPQRQLWWMGGWVCGFRDAVGKSALEKPERTLWGASSSPGKGRSEEGDGMG